MAKDIQSNIVLKVQSKAAEDSFSKLRNNVTKLGRELKKLSPGTEEFKKKASELKTAKERFQEVKKEIDTVNQSLKNSTNSVNGFLGKLGNASAFLGQISFVAIGAGATKVASNLIEVADAMTDVEKTTGMATQEVKQLWDAFDEMDTRTSKLDRLKIAEVGGRLGVPKEEMASFVQEVDKAYVALGDSFEGGLENVVESLGKIKGLFNETKGESYAEAINQVGSALNELAAAGTASEGNISEFALRVGALPDAVKPALDKVLGLGTAFEESGIDAQIASSGFSNFMKVAGENVDKFAYSMNLPIEKAKELLNNNPEEFFLKFAEGMRGLPADETAKIFDSLSLKSLEVQKAVGAAANNTDKFREAMELSNQKMQEANSLTNEFNKKNNNAPAVLEKLKNAFSGLFTKTNIINHFEKLISVIGWLTGVTKEGANGIVVFKERLKLAWNIVKIVTSAIIGYKTALIATAIIEGNYTKAKWLGIIADKAFAITTYAKNVVLSACNILVGVLTGNTQKATAATLAFNTATKASPIGLIVGLITACVVAYQVLSSEIKNATNKQKILNDVNSEATKSIASEKNELENYLKIAKDETASKETRIRAIKKLNEISPEYLGNLNLENINTVKATDAVRKYTDALMRNAKAKVLNKKLEKKTEEYENFKEKSVAEQAGKDILWRMTGGVLKLTGSDAQKLDKSMFKQYELWKKTGGGVKHMQIR